MVNTSKDYTESFEMFCQAMADDMNMDGMKHADKANYTAEDVKGMECAVSAFQLTLELAGVIE